MYAILTDNVELILYLKKSNATFFEAIQQIDHERYNEAVLVTTMDKRIAIIALVEGSKVYETITMNSLIPLCSSKEKLVDRIIDNFLEALGIRKTSKGYEYLKYMLKCNVEDDNYCLKPMTSEVYPECAKKFNVSPATVARYSNILIKNSYNRNPLRYNVLYYGTHMESSQETPKVRNFVVFMANKIRKLISAE